MNAKSENMRILFTIPHFFGDGPNCYGSTVASQRQKRVHSLRTCIASVHQHFAGRQKFLLCDGTARDVNQAMLYDIDVVVCVRGENHLLAELDLPEGAYRVHSTEIEDPILLGYSCYDVFREAVGSYDWYCFLEDDIIISDPLFFRKLDAFYAVVGSARYLLQPNRYELGIKSELSKVYVDGPLWKDSKDFWAQQRFPGYMDEVMLPFGGSNFRAVPAENCHAGCFFLTETHLRHMLEQPWYGEKVTGYADRLASAANMYILVLFNVFKPAAECSSFLEVFHSHQKYVASENSGVIYAQKSSGTAETRNSPLDGCWEKDLDRPWRREIHESWFRTDTIDYWRHERMYEPVFKCLADARQAKWLTIGDGRYGLDAIRMGRNGFVDVTATDIDDSLLRHSLENGALEKALSEDAERLSFADKSYDYVLCKEAFHHFERPMIALYEMLRVAGQGVVLIEPQDPYIDLPVYGRPHVHFYEDEGSYIYTLSQRELEKVALGLRLPAVAFKNICDQTVEGAYQQLAVAENPLFADLVQRLQLQEGHCARGEEKFSMLLAVLFVAAPSELTIRQFIEHGWYVEQF